jgi:glycine oxidase
MARQGRASPGGRSIIHGTPPGPRRPGTPRGYDAVVVGAGVIGLAIAFRAAQRGLAVAIADPHPGSGASRAAAGMLAPVSEAWYGEEELLGFGLTARERYPSFAAELTELTGAPTGFTQTGTLQVAYDGDDLAVLERVHELHLALGLEARRVTAREARAIEPMLAPAVRGGVHMPADGSVDPRLLTRALLLAAERCEVAVHREQVTEVTITADRADGVRLTDGTRLAAATVVLATGWQSGEIGGVPPDVLPPVRPVKGQILRLHSQQPILAGSVRGIVRGSPVYLVPRASGELVIGATQEELGTDTRVTAGGVWELLRDARELVPGITELELAEVTAGLRPGTPDNAPVLGPSALPGLVLATGHFRSGILLAPVTADLIAEFLDTKRLPRAAARFSPARFWAEPFAAEPAAEPFAAEPFAAEPFAAEPAAEEAPG